MDPINLIIDALMAGAKDTASQVMKDTYSGLKALIKRRFSQKPDKEAAKDAEKTLVKYETEPDIYEKLLRKELAEAGVNQDQEVLEIARKMLDLISSQQKKTEVNMHIINNGQIDQQFNIAEVDKMHIHYKRD